MGKVICFFAPEHRSGCTMISQCLAEHTARSRRDARVLLLHCHAREGTLFSPQVRESMDRIKPYLASGHADLSEISEMAHWKDNLYVIGGLSALGGGEDFLPDMASFLIRELACCFDRIICDAGSDPDQGIALGALLCADCVYTVLTQRESSLRRYEWLQPLYQRLGLPQAGIVLNCYEPSDPYSEQYVSRRLGEAPQRLLCVRRSEYGGLAEIEERSLLGFKDTRFNKGIAALAASVDELCGSPVQEESHGSL